MALRKCIHLGASRSHLLAGKLVVGRPAFSCLTHGCMCSPYLTSPSSALHTNAVEGLHGTGSINWQSGWSILMQQDNIHRSNVAQGLLEKGALYRAKWMRHLQLMARYRLWVLLGNACQALWGHGFVLCERQSQSHCCCCCALMLLMFLSSLYCNSPRFFV